MFAEHRDGFRICARKKKNKPQFFFFFYIKQTLRWGMPAYNKPNSIHLRIWFLYVSCILLCVYREAIHRSFFNLRYAYIYIQQRCVVKEKNLWCDSQSLLYRAAAREWLADDGKSVININLWVSRIGICFLMAQNIHSRTWVNNLGSTVKGVRTSTF